MADNMEQLLRDALEEARLTIEALEEKLNQLAAMPYAVGQVRQQLADGTMLVAAEGKLLQVEKPVDVDEEIRRGDTVALALQTMQIVAKLAGFEQLGEISVVRDVNNDLIEVEVGGSTRLASFDKEKMEIKKGDRVLLDSSNSVVIKNLGRETNRFALATQQSITWNDIGGLEEAKAEMVEAIELPHRHPEIYEYYGKKPLRGLMLYGPPGCGKTLLGKAAASAIAEIYKDDEAPDANAFMYIKGPEILDKYVGVAEQTIRSIFSRARMFKEKHGHPCVVFIDEADSILSKRGSGVSSDMEKTIVPMFLSEMDGLDDNAALIILATNRPDTLDPAVLRDGRIDRKIGIPRPDAHTAEEIFKVHLKNIPFGDKLVADEIAQFATATMYGEDAALYHINKKDGSIDQFTLGHITNGAMIAGIVDQATSFAMHRDIQTHADPTGVTREDVHRAVCYVTKQNRELEFKDDVKEFVTPFKDQVKGIAKVTA